MSSNLYLLHIHNADNDFFEIHRTPLEVVVSLIEYVTGWWEGEITTRPIPISITPEDVEFYMDESGEWSNVAVIDTEKMTVNTISQAEFRKAWNSVLHPKRKRMESKDD